MYCRKCGKELKGNDKFCRYCGEPVSENEIDNIPQKEELEINNKKKSPKRTLFFTSIRLFFKMLFLIILIAIVCSIIVLTLDKLKIVDFDKYFEKSASTPQVILTGEVLNDMDYEVDVPEAEKYFGDKAIIVEKVSVSDSNKIQNEKSVTKELSERKFDINEMTSHYTINGEYYEDEIVSEESTVEHPTYQLLYVNSTNELWTISVINGAVMATPISYNMQADTNRQYIVSESEYITSYDVTTNTFYITKPKAEVLNVYIADKIDSELLDSLTIEVINNL